MQRRRSRREKRQAHTVEKEHHTERIDIAIRRESTNTAANREDANRQTYRRQERETEEQREEHISETATENRNKTQHERQKATTDKTRTED